MALTNDRLTNAITGGNTTATFSAGQTQSSPIFVGGASFVGLRLPEFWDGGNITFLESQTENGNYRAVCTGNGEIVTIASPAANRTYKDSGYPSVFYALQYIRVVSASAVAADRIVEAVMSFI